MKNIDEILANCGKEYALIESLGQVCGLLDTNKVSEAKDILQLEMNVLSKNAPNKVLHRILRMLDIYKSSNRKVKDVIQYHITYTDILDTTMCGTRWVYGTDYKWISEIESVITSTVENMIPENYDILLTHTSVYDYNIMTVLHGGVDDRLIQSVSNIMTAIESLDVYLVHHVLIENNDMSVNDILNLCDKLEMGSE
nr:MAG TPA: hypothetical protein [Caudoviricetes sp.]